MIILAIRSAVFVNCISINSINSIKFVNWLFSMIAKSSFETSPNAPVPLAGDATALAWRTKKIADTR